MTIKVNERQARGITILDLSGRIALGKETAAFRDSIRERLAQGKKNILLNLGEVPYIDSTGIGELVSAFIAARREGGDVKLLNLTRKVRDTVEIVKLGSIFELFDDEASALKSFTQARTEPGSVARAS